MSEKKKSPETGGVQLSLREQLLGRFCSNAGQLFQLLLLIFQQLAILLFLFQDRSLQLVQRPLALIDSDFFLIDQVYLLFQVFFLVDQPLLDTLKLGTS